MIFCCNGKIWENPKNHISDYYSIKIKFNFKFHVYINNINSILDSFRTSYWLLKKQWYVTYDNYYLFTIPYFATTCSHIRYHNKTVYDKIKSIVIDLF